MFCELNYVLIVIDFVLFENFRKGSSDTCIIDTAEKE